MSLRARMGLASGLAVAVAVIAVAVTAYAGTRSELQGQVDKSLNQLVAPILIRGGVVKSPSGGGEPGGQVPGASGEGQVPGASGEGQVPGTSGEGFPAGGAGAGGPGFAFGYGSGFGAGAAQSGCGTTLGLDYARGGSFGGPQGYVQLVRPQGTSCLPTGEKTKLPVDAAVRAVARRGRGSYLTDANVGANHLRILVHGVGSRGAVEVALPLKEVDDTLSSQELLLILIAAGGIAVAALLGALVARTALAPIARFTRQTESIASRPDRLESERLEVQGGDELGRLAQTFNRTLDALQQSVQAQRNLVADASHELRTPIATIRANLQLMRDEERLAPADVEALRRDVIEELDELTALVSDVVELARGAKLGSEPGDVRLDLIVEAVVQRARRRAPQLTVAAELEPTLVRGEGDRIARAVTNLLDNAVKWSPAQGTIEVALHGGELTVRDYGPGFADEDLPFVFDRFHRARAARAKAGSGLGLAIVRQAAEAHGGSVTAGNAPGGGAVMRIGFGPATATDDEPAPDPVRS